MIEDTLINEWVSVCEIDDLNPGTGVAVSLGGDQVAVFKMLKDNKIYAISNYDPIGKANVLSRGITGSIGDELVVSSPLYKQHFNLQTGECLENKDASVKTYPVRVHDKQIQLQYQN
jgi:nitrite reductase (NADH) small subunit